MNRFTRIALTASALSLAVVLAGCESFDPTDIFNAEIFNTKKKLPGERRAVFPEGTPGVPQGVPQELVKGYQQQPEQAEAPQAVAPPPVEPKPKPKPKPKVVAKPKEESAPTAVTVRPSQPQSQPPQSQGQTQWPDPPSTRPQQSGGVAWPDPPATR
jgi:outer membrane biosynthesis protein TonB